MLQPKQYTKYSTCNIRPEVKVQGYIVKSLWNSHCVFMSRSRSKVSKLTSMCTYI